MSKTSETTTFTERNDTERNDTERNDTEPRRAGQPATSPAVSIAGSRVTIRLSVDDGELAAHLADLDATARVPEVERILKVGVRGLAAMGVSATVGQVAEQVERVLAEVSDDAEARVSAVVSAASQKMREDLDPSIQESATARTIAAIRTLHDELASRLDPANRDGHTGRLVDRLTELLGPGGTLESTLAAALDAALDPDSAESGLARLQASFDRNLAELRDAVVADRAKREEAVRGTAKGFEFEDTVEQVLRSEAARMGGTLVEATGFVAGSLGAQTKVGDFVVTLPDGSRVVIEAKNAARLTVGGKGGVLAELDTAMANRGGRFGVCVSSSDDAYPAEVGCFSLYGNRLLIADDGSGTLIRAALRWAAAAVRSDRAVERPVDVAEITDGVARIHELATRISNAKRTLSTVRSGVDQARNDLDALRDDLLDRVDELTRRLGPVAEAGDVRVA
jgi:hypothetical protein